MGANSMTCICGREMHKLFSLPDYPFTEREGVMDQGFLFCDCGHGRLQTIVPGLYGELRTGKSDSAKHSIDVFAEFVMEHVSTSETVIDIGGNDGSLAKQFHARNYLLVDPQASFGLKTTIEQVDLKPYKHELKLILSSHTLEHVPDPHVFMRKVSECMTEDDILALQFPSLEMLVEDSRMDHIHHQHIHYFSERSISRLLAKYGFKVIASKFNPDHWGALMLVCKKGVGAVQGGEITANEILNARISFRLEMAACEMRLKRRAFISYGASQMLPILSYYLPSIEKAQFIADDNESVSGVWRNRAITNQYNFAGRDVLITGISSKYTARKLVQKALGAGARNVIVPLHQL